MEKNAIYYDSPLAKAAALTNWTQLGKACGVSYMAVQAWERGGRLPMPCLLELQDYHHKIAAAVNNEVTAEELLAWSLEGHRRDYGVTA